jgi:hypothetical protein
MMLTARSNRIEALLRHITTVAHVQNLNTENRAIDLSLRPERHEAIIDVVDRTSNRVIFRHDYGEAITDDDIWGFISRYLGEAHPHQWTLTVDDPEFGRCRIRLYSNNISARLYLRIFPSSEHRAA